MEQPVAAHLGVDPEQVLLTNGVDEAIHLLCETYLEPGDEVLIVVPDVRACTRSTPRPPARR